MFQRILVPLDDATRTAAALRIASGIARQTGAQLVLMCAESNAMPAQRVLSAGADLQCKAAFLHKQGMHVEYTVEVGSHEQGIIAAARGRQVDLILLVPKHRHVFELLWYSRGASRLLHELPAPLLIWPESYASTMLLASDEAAVMVPLDGAPEAERSLPFAMTLAVRYHRPLVLVRAVPAPSDRNCMRLAHGDDSCDRLQQAKVDLAATRERLESLTTVPIQTALVTGEPGTQLLRAAQAYRAGVIALCAHSHPTIERYFMGSVSTQILRQARVPVLIVPPHLEALVPTDRGEAIAPGVGITAAIPK